MDVDIFEVRERGEAFAEATIDRGSLLIQNVTLLGKHSKNNRTYSDRAMNDAARLYEGAPFFLDHPTARDLRERKGVRSVLDLAGKIRNPRHVGDRVRGDIQLLDHEPTKGLVFAIAEQMPDAAGNSHRAVGEVSKTDDGEVVESLSRVFAVELVTDPATTEGLFESLQPDPEKESTMEYKDITLSALTEQRSDLVQAIQKQISEGAEVETMKSDLKTLRAENDTLKAANAERDRLALIEAKLAEAKLPDTLVTDVFKEQLSEAKDEKRVDELIADRQGLAKTLKSKGPRSVEHDIDESLNRDVDEDVQITPDLIGQAADTLFH